MRCLSHPSLRRFLLGSLAVSAAAAAAAAGQPLPCGVTDPSGRTGFVANAAGGIDALDLATGDVLWDVKVARRPALAVDDRLFAWTPVGANGLRVLAFDRTHDGRRLLESDPVTLPDWVSVEEAPGRSFTARWRLEKGRLILDWEARAWFAGPHPTPEAEAQAMRQADGRVRFDLETGKAETGLAEKPSAGPPPPAELEKAVVRWRGPAGAGWAELVLDEAEGRRRLSLWSWDAEKVNSPKELFTGKRPLVLPALGDRFLCLRDATPCPDQGVASEDCKRYGWSIFSVADGGRLTQVPYEPGTEALSVVGPRVYALVAGPLAGPLDKPFVRPRSLKAFDLKTGKPLWQRPVEGKLIAPPAP